MRFTFYATLFVTASAVYIRDEDHEYANHLWAQFDDGKISHEAVAKLAANHWFSQIDGETVQSDR